jgi:AraC family transcriptional regulator of adaptative response / DNA-3-methyladenine glycosylase II
VDITDTEACYRAVQSRDRRFDGVFYTGVLSTGIYCRPSCPAITPRRRNVTFHPTAAAAQLAGCLACKRCLPDATPGSPRWDVTADVAGRAMRLIADGVVEREGVEGLATRLGYSARHLNRMLLGEPGAGPLALARARRAQTARILLQTTTMPITEAAFAAGFSSVRQFNQTIREVYGSTPSALRGRGSSTAREDGVVELRLAVRAPYAGPQLLGFLAARTVRGVEATGPDWYERTLRLPGGPGRVRLTFPAAPETVVRCLLRLTDMRDLSAAVERCRRLLDADCDPVAVDAILGADPVLGPLVSSLPGLRVPGHVDGDEVAVRAVLGQQVSVLRAHRLAGTLVERYGEPVPGVDADEAPDRLFPTAAALSEVDPAELPMPRSRGRGLVELCRRIAGGEIVLDRSADREQVRARLLDVPGIGPWTAGYIAMRALGDPDVFLPTDVGVRHALQRARLPVEAADRWRPWRSSALMHLWTSTATAKET